MYHEVVVFKVLCEWRRRGPHQSNREIVKESERRTKERKKKKTRKSKEIARFVWYMPRDMCVWW